MKNAYPFIREVKVEIVIFAPSPYPYKWLRNIWLVLLEIDEGITDSPDGSLRDAATATDFDPSDSSVPRYVKYFFSKQRQMKSERGPV